MSDQNEHKPEPFFWPKLHPRPTICTRKSQNWSSQLQICHEIIRKAVVFEKNRTARIPVSGLERYGALWCSLAPWCYATRHHNGFSTPNLPWVPTQEVGGCRGGGRAKQKQEEIRSQLKGAGWTIRKPQYPPIIINRVAAILIGFLAWILPSLDRWNRTRTWSIERHLNNFCGIGLSKKEKTGCCEPVVAHGYVETQTHRAPVGSETN